MMGGDPVTEVARRPGSPGSSHSAETSSFVGGLWAALGARASLHPAHRLPLGDQQEGQCGPLLPPLLGLCPFWKLGRCAPEPRGAIRNLMCQLLRVAAPDPTCHQRCPFLRPPCPVQAGPWKGAALADRNQESEGLSTGQAQLHVRFTHVNTQDVVGRRAGGGCCGCFPLLGIPIFFWPLV